MIGGAYRPLLKSFYLVGGLVIVSALSQPLLQVWPFRPGDARWRFGAAGLLSTALDSVILGVVLLMATAVLLRHWRALRLIGAVCVLAALVLSAMAVIFGLDFLEIRTTINPRVRGTLDLTVLRALVLVGLSIPTVLFMGVASWRSTRRSAHVAEAAAAGPGLIYRTQLEETPAAGAVEGSLAAPSHE